MIRGPYILICNDSSGVDVNRVDAYEIAKARLDKNIWPLFKSTSNRKTIMPGSQCLVYLAGYGRCKGHLIGSATVKEVASVTGRDWVDPCDKALTDLPVNALLLDSVERWTPLDIRPLIADLEFVTVKGSWGVHMQGGCRRIGKRDYELICSKHSPA